MLTDGFYRGLASLLLERARSGEQNFIAIGEGDPAWDLSLPAFRRATTQLVGELARKAVEPDDVVYLDERGQASVAPTSSLRLAAIFEPGEGTGRLREVGLFGGAASAAANSGTLMSYIIHRRLEKTAQMALSRAFRLDLTPRASGPGQIETRYLGNANSQEFHDLDNLTPSCQVDEIRFDRRLYFADPEQAVALGYDFCAYCFPGQSRR